MSSPGRSSASLHQLLQISSVLNSLQTNRSSYVYDSDSEYDQCAPTWTAINHKTKKQLKLAEEATVAVDREEGEIFSDEDSSDVFQLLGNESEHGDEKELLFSIQDDQPMAFHVPTGVYMMNTKARSWVGRLSDDEETKHQEIQSAIALNHVRRAQQMANAALRAAERQTACPSPAADIPGLDSTEVTDVEEHLTAEAGEAKERDERLRNDTYLIKCTLRGAGILALKYPGAHDVDDDMRCKYAYCSSDDQCIAARSYYIIVSTPGSSLYTMRYCLPCLEALWNGELFVGQPPDPRVFNDGKDEKLDIETTDGMCPAENKNYFGEQRRDSAQPISIDQSMLDGPALLLASKHAPKADEMAALQPNKSQQIQQKRSNAPPIKTSALRSTLQPPPVGPAANSFHRYSPTRFQHLANLIQPGQGLNAVEKAVLELWKGATEEQMRWSTIGPFSALARGKDVAAAVDRGRDVESMKEICGLGRGDCFGRDLSDVLAMVAAR